MRNSRLCGYFDAVVLSYEAGLQKPDPRIFTLAAESADGSSRRRVRPLWDEANPCQIYVMSLK